MRNYKSLVLIIGLSIGLFSLAQASNSNKGTTSAEFLKLGAGARSVALGEAYTAMADEASALYWNPGALVQVPSKSLVVMHGLYFDSSYFDYLSYAQSLGNIGAFGVSYQYYTSGDIDKTDINGNNIGSFTPSDQAITLGYAYAVRGYGLGLSMKSVSSKIINSDSTLSADVGILSPAFLNNKLKLAFTGRNLFGSLKYRTESADLPTEYRIGSAYKINEKWNTGLDVAFPKNDDTYAAIGTEYVFGNKTGLQIAGRAGYNSKTAGDVDGFTGFGFGMGFLFQKFSLDYAIVPFGSIGLAHRFSLSFNF